MRLSKARQQKAPEQAAQRRPRSKPAWPLHHQPEAVTFIRERSGFTKKQLSDLSGVSLSHLCEIEKGTRNAGPDVLGRLAKALNCPVVVLERRRDEPEPSEPEPERAA